MPTINTNVILTALLYAVLTGILNLVFSKKTQINAWCAANPRLAALGMFMRSVGFDPHNLWSFATLLITKKLPAIKFDDSPIAKAEQKKADAKALSVANDFGDAGPLLVLLLLALAVHQQGCARMADPCSEVTLATIQVGCEARIEQECNGDPKCPAYVECTKAIKTWRSCGATP